MSSRREFLPVCLLLLLAGSALGRQWTDKNGKNVDAELIAVKNEKVYLEKSDGTLLAVPLTNLSQADRDYLQSLSDGKKPTADSEFGKLPVSPVSPAGKSAEAAQAGHVRSLGDMVWGAKSLAFSPDGKRLAVGRTDRMVMVLDVNNAQRLSVYEQLETLAEVSASKYTPDGKKLISGGSTGKIGIWDVGGNGQIKPVGQFVGHNGAIQCLSVTADSRLALSGSDDKSARLWEIATGREVAEILGFKGAVKACFVSPDGKEALASDGETFIRFDLAAKQATQTQKLASYTAQTVAISPTGTLIVVSDGYTLRMWDAATGSEMPKFQDREIQWTAEFSPDGKRLISGGSGKFNLWDVETKKRIYSGDVDKGIGYIQTLAVSPDGLHVATQLGMAGQQLHLYRLPPLD